MSQLTIMSKLSAFTYYARNKKGLSQSELAQKLDSKGINNNYISRLENGNLEGISLPVLAKLLDALDSDLDFKYNEKEDDGKEE